MFKPLFNQVLVELDDKDAKWGKGNDDSFAGDVFREGKLLGVGVFVPTNDYPLSPDGMDAALELVKRMISKTVMWNEGHEAGKVFDHDGKKYAFVYWWDIVGVKE